MPPPARRIFSFAEAARFRPIQNRLNPPADTARSLRRLRPKRLKHIHYHPDADRPHRHTAKRRGDMSGERICPLLMMLGMTPARLVSFDIGGSAVIEGHCARSFDLFLSAHGLTALDRIDLVGQQQSLLGGFFARIGKPYLRKPSEPHLTCFAIEHVTEYPAFGAGDPQIEPRAIRIHPWLRGGSDLSCRQPVQSAGHEPSSTAQSHKMIHENLWDCSERR